jgi:hypothetical protein
MNGIEVTQIGHGSMKIKGSETKGVTNFLTSFTSLRIGAVM